MANTPIIVGNWKMNGTVGETLKMITELRHKLSQNLTAEVVVAPPFTALYSASVALQDMPVKLAGQDLHWETEGPYTGEISALFLKDVGCSYVLIGHSERRQFFGETDDTVNRKVRGALIQELTPVLCIGETAAERQTGKTEGVLEIQLRKGLQGMVLKDLESLVVAYEPVWAIGTGQTATVAEIETAHQFIRNFLGRLYDAPTANTTRLIYGGSVTPDNAKSILGTKNVDGVLVGGASLIIEKFLKIIQSAER